MLELCVAKCCLVGASAISDPLHFLPVPQLSKAAFASGRARARLHTTLQLVHCVRLAPLFNRFGLLQAAEAFCAVHAPLPRPVASTMASCDSLVLVTYVDFLWSCTDHAR